jgi:fumarylacetoacetate (FAA) hydrolase family protein
MAVELSDASLLPRDGTAGTLIGRVFDPRVGGPSVVAVRDDGVHDLSARFPTVRDLCETADPAAAAAMDGPRIAALGELVANTFAATRDVTRPWLLAPVDLQTLKAAGVTFAVSMMERIIEERARGDFAAAARVRERIDAELGVDLRTIRPGSPEALQLKQVFEQAGLWSQYMEVGLGPDAEIFTKAPTLAAVGTGSDVGIPALSAWNNPEPEAAVIVASDGRIVGATLANDVNLRDLEGRSALLLAQAKDNNASCALGPLVRLFDASFDLDAVRAMEVRLEIVGSDGFALRDASPMSEISRDPVELVAQLLRSHQYPDGAVLMLGTMFAPTTDRDRAGMGFTHQPGDVVRISSDALGTLVNQVQHCAACDPWTFGIRDLMTNLAERKLL